MRQILLALAGWTIGVAQPAIPDPIALLKEVAAHQRDMDDIRENYTFHRIRRVEELDKKGAVAKTESQEREVFFVNGWQIARLVKKNGVALSPSEDKGEQERVRKLTGTRLKSGPRTGQEGRRRSTITDILAMSKITNPRRVSFHGRDTLAFDFAGDPNARAHSTQENAAKKMGGSIWIDEADRQVARIEVRFDDKFKIGGGLVASIQQGTNMILEQAPVGQGLWMQTSSDQHIDVRIVVKGLRQDVHVRDSDFKRFDVGAVEQIHTPVQ